MTKSKEVQLLARIEALEAQVRDLAASALRTPVYIPVPYPVHQEPAPYWQQPYVTWGSGTITGNYENSQITTGPAQTTFTSRS